MNNLIKSFEGLVLDAYVDPATGGEPITIGYGTTIYPSGTKVNMGDVCTEIQADEWLAYDVSQFTEKVEKLVKVELNANQLEALTSFAYNLGSGNLAKSTLLKKVNINSNDETIAAEFMKWNKAAGKVMRGLTRRRLAEAQLYFTEI